MKIRITAPGIYGADGELAIGTEMTVKRAPEGWNGRYQVIDRGALDDATAVTNEDDAAQEPGPLDGSIEELETHLEGVDDADEIQRLIDAETAGKSRKGALAALEARRDELLGA